jgi:hypothetical protein
VPTSPLNAVSALNLATVFAPTLLRPEVETVETILSDEPKQFLLFALKEYKELFLVRSICFWLTLCRMEQKPNQCFLQHQVFE